jgi:hypothetical protein
MDAIWVEKIIFLVIVVLIYFRLNSPTHAETFKKFLEPTLKLYEEDDDESVLTTDAPSSIP